MRCSVWSEQKALVNFRQHNAKANRTNGPRSTGIRTVEDAVQQWLDTCEKEGRDGRDPVRSSRSTVTGTIPAITKSNRIRMR